MPSNEPSDNPVTRRKVMRALGIGGVVGLAGCSGDSATTTDSSGNNNNDNNDDTTDSSGNNNNDGSEDTPTTEEGVELVDKVLRLPDYQAGGAPTNEMQWNPHAKQPITYYPVREAFIGWDPESSEWVPVGCDFEFNQSEQYFDLWPQEDVMWFPHEEPVTARDISIGPRIALARTDSNSNAQGLTNYLESVEVLEDEGVARFHMDKAYNQDLVFLKLIHQDIVSKWEYYEDHVKRLEAAESGSDAEQEAITKLQQDRMEHPDKAHYTGMFSYEGVEAQEVTLARNDKHRHADYINFNGIKYTYLGSAQKHWGELLANNIDVYDDRQTLVTGSMAKMKPDHVKLAQQKKNGGLSLVPSHANSPGLQNRHVRRAIAYYIDREQVANNVNEFNKSAAPGPVCGLSEKGMSAISDATDSYTTYGPGSMPEKGDEEMRKAGWEKQDGKWVNGDGERPEWPVNVSADMGEWLSAARSVAQQAQDHGLNMPLSANEHTSHWDAYFEGTWEGFSMGFWGHPASPSPYQQLWLTLLRDPIPSPAAGIDASSLEAPMPVGNSGGEVQSVDAESPIRLLETSTDEAERKDAIKKASWAFNQNMPHIPLQTGIHTAAYSDARFEFPDPDSPWINKRLLEIQFIADTTMKHGLMQAKSN